MRACALIGIHALVRVQAAARAAARHAALGGAGRVAPHVILAFQKVDFLQCRGKGKPRQLLVMIILAIAPIVHDGLRGHENAQLFEMVGVDRLQKFGHLGLKRVVRSTMEAT